MDTLTVSGTPTGVQGQTRLREELNGLQSSIRAAVLRLKDEQTLNALIDKDPADPGWDRFVDQCITHLEGEDALLETLPNIPRPGDALYDAAFAFVMDVAEQLRESIRRLHLNAPVTIELLTIDRNQLSQLLGVSVESVTAQSATDEPAIAA